MPEIPFRSRWRKRKGLPNADVSGGRHALAVLAAYLAAITACHMLAMMAFEGLDPGDAAWLTATTMTTVG